MHQIPSLPYKYSDLEPAIDEETMRIHHTKHHQGYADKLNAALERHPELFDQDLEKLIRQASSLLPEDIRAAVVNFGGGFLNHNFLWESLAPSAGVQTSPTGLTVGVLIEEQFGNYNDFKETFKKQALSLFGSGWTWLTYRPKEEKLEIVNTANQNLLPAEHIPLMTADVWEHAYYLKYQNRRDEYLNNNFNVINWPKADERLKKVTDESGGDG